ncbi:MAG: hypothetical protein R3B93_22770 [Bacteroidia bacterium]
MIPSKKKISQPLPFPDGTSQNDQVTSYEMTRQNGTRYAKRTLFATGEVSWIRRNIRDQHITTKGKKEKGGGVSEDIFNNHYKRTIIEQHQGKVASSPIFQGFAGIDHWF